MRRNVLLGILLGAVITSGTVVASQDVVEAQSTGCPASLHQYFAAVCASNPASLWTFGEGEGASSFADSIRSANAVSRGRGGFRGRAKGPGGLSLNPPQVP